MSLDNIQLPPIVIQQLFKRSLTDVKNEETPKEKTTSKGFSTLGNNGKHICILVQSEEHLHLPEDQLNFLLGILAACNLTMEDVAILNIHKNKAVTYQTVTGDLKSEKLFLFGVSPARIQMPLEFPHYQIQRFNNQVYLSLPPLADFQENKSEKTKLWNCLRQIFGI